MGTASRRWLSIILLVIIFVGLCGVASAQPGALPGVYQNWLDEDVRWIIAPVEKVAFMRLMNDADRDQFVIQFWIRRDPTPGTVENEYKEEHYRRIAYSNVHFAAKVRGSLTDRGRTYIVDGPPDRIVKVKGVALGSAHPIEVWIYQAIPGSEKEVKFTFDEDAGDYLLAK